jgi:catechol 2,3-dioxygenase-like lactoylglutathione lyase family enzyme
METQTKPRLVGINHVALEVGDVEAALAFYGAISASRFGAATTMPMAGVPWLLSTWATNFWR